MANHGARRWRAESPIMELNQGKQATTVMALMARDIGELKSNLINNMKGEQAYYVQNVGELRCPNFFDQWRAFMVMATMALDTAWEPLKIEQAEYCHGEQGGH